MPSETLVACLFELPPHYGFWVTQRIALWSVGGTNVCCFEAQKKETDRLRLFPDARGGHGLGRECVQSPCIGQQPRHQGAVYVRRPGRELHYNFTDATGSNENDFERLVLKPIYFPSQTKLNEDWGLKTAVGLDWSIEFNNEDKGIGVGADTIAPFVGVALNHAPSSLVLIPLLQHFVNYRSNDTDVNLTSLRLIAIRPFGKGYWGKLDAKIPYDWESENWLPTAEVQLGYNINETFAVFVEALIGVGKDRPYDGGGGLGLRLKY